LTGVWPNLGARAPGWGDEWTSWVYGVIAFATALYLLLSWRSRDRAEDAHA
jgi:hypothetical protein